MKINKIELFNVGPYEGLNIFDIEGQGRKGNINVIGGQNGAGKTTLFTAIKLCLYGYKESGYSAMNKYYKQSIKKLINDTAKIENNPKAYVALTITIFNGQDWDIYYLKRSWDLSTQEFETFSVQKNSDNLSEEEIDDFKNYILNIIPPELFNLYFFDGEQIADFFLNDTSGEKIKEAFLTICGYDTFDILYKNFKRIGIGTNEDNQALEKYFKAENVLSDSEQELTQCKGKLARISSEIENADSELAELEKNYASAGGVSLEEWNNKFLEIKNEERIREEKNTWVKTAANDNIPYIIMRNEIVDLLRQIDNEEETEKENAFWLMVEKILPGALDKTQKEVDGLSDPLKDKIYKNILELCGNTSELPESILNLSKNERNQLRMQISSLLMLDKNLVIGARNEIKRSIDRVQEWRCEIDKSSIAHIDEFLKDKESIIANKQQLLVDSEKNAEFLKELEAAAAKANAEYKLAEKELEKQLKNKSISGLTSKSILFLEELQRRLFKSEILRVEEQFMYKINQLVRKNQFISKIKIDDDFVIHVYKKVHIDCKGVCARIKAISAQKYLEEYGEIHCEDILAASGCQSLDDFMNRYNGLDKVLDVVVEFDKKTMSKGEKQVFIMALYWAMMQLCNKEVPFIIDTPFARIDTIHRNHITEYFFKELKGQVFIFSTDEEIDAKHLETIGDDLEGLFLIENPNNTRTTITSNCYFGE